MKAHKTVSEVDEATLQMSLMANAPLNRCQDGSHLQIVDMFSLISPTPACNDFPFPKFAGNG